MILISKRPAVIHGVRVSGPVLYLMPEEEPAEASGPGASWAYNVGKHGLSSGYSVGTPWKF